MQLGPVEYVVIDFPGDRFTGAIAPAIAALVDRGLVRILDLVFVKKDADGVVLTFEYDELAETAEFAAIEGSSDGVLSDADVADLAAGLEPRSSALFVLFEDLWAAELGHAVREAGGELLTGGRIPHAVITEALAAAGANRAGGGGA